METLTVNVLDLSLDDFAGGALRERFDSALRRVLANIDDPNTDGKPRVITATVKLAPNKDRTSCAVVIAVKTTLRADDAVETTLFIERHGPDSFRVAEFNPRQMPLDDGPNPTVAPDNRFTKTKGS